jgi:SsrA-binding protein
VSAVVTDNRKAHHDFFIEDKFEAGIALLGWEVKSARAGTVNLKDSFVYFEKDGAVLKNAHFSPYSFGDVKTQESRRDRRLLLNKSEMRKIFNAVRAKGYTCVPTKVYFNKKGILKVEIALAKGKHTYDKKAALKERDILRETQRVELA